MSYGFRVKLSKFWFQPVFEEKLDLESLNLWIEGEKKKGKVFECEFAQYKTFSLTFESSRIEWLSETKENIISWPDVKEEFVLTSTHSHRSIFQNRHFRISYTKRSLLSSKQEGVIPIAFHDIASGPQYFFMSIFNSKNNQLIGKIGFRAEMNEVLGPNMEILLQHLDLSRVQVFDRIPSEWREHLTKIKIRVQYMDFSMVQDSTQHNLLQLSANARSTSKSCVDLFQTVKDHNSFETHISDIKLSMAEGKDFSSVKSSFLCVTLFLCVDQNMTQEGGGGSADFVKFVKSNELSKFELMSRLSQIQTIKKESGWSEIEFGSCLIPFMFNYHGVGTDKITSSSLIEEKFIYHHQFSHVPHSSSKSFFEEDSYVTCVLNILGGPSYSQMMQGLFDGTGVTNGIVPIGFPLPQNLSTSFRNQKKKIKYFSHAEQAFRLFGKQQDKFFFNSNRYRFPIGYFESNVLLRELKSKQKNKNKGEDDEEEEEETETDTDFQCQTEQDIPTQEEEEEEEEEEEKKREKQTSRLSSLAEDFSLRRFSFRTLHLPFSKSQTPKQAPEIFTPTFRERRHHPSRRKTFSFGSSWNEKDIEKRSSSESPINEPIIQELPFELTHILKSGCEEIQHFIQITQKTKEQLPKLTSIQDYFQQKKQWEKKMEAHDQIQMNCIHPKFCQFINNHQKQQLSIKEVRK